jgi:hypothetical protein
LESPLRSRLVDEHTIRERIATVAAPPKQIELAERRLDTVRPAM